MAAIAAFIAAEDDYQRRNDLDTLIVDYEDGKLGHREEIALFSRLIKNGMAWTLQGHYGSAG
jgi:hypothetical protein